MSILVIVGVSWAFGTWALRALELESPGWPLRFLLGTSLCGALILGVGLFSLGAVRLVLYGVAAVGVGYEIVVRESAMGVWNARRDTRDGMGAYEWACVVAVAAALGMSFISALAPAVGWEETTAHLPLARSWAEAGRIQYIEGNPYSAFANPLHCLYAYAYSEDGESSVRLLSWLLGALACGAAHGLAKRIAGERAAWIAAAAVATAPVFYEDAGSVSIDLVMAALVVEALLWWREWVLGGERRALVTAGFLAGSAAVLRPAGSVALALLTAFVVAAAVGAKVVAMARQAWARDDDAWLYEEDETAALEPEIPPAFFPSDESGVQGFLDFDAAAGSPGLTDRDSWFDSPTKEEVPLDESGGVLDVVEEEAPSGKAEVNFGERAAGLLALGECLAVMAGPALVALLPWWIFSLAAGSAAPGFPYAGNMQEALRLGLRPDPGHWFMFPWDIVMRPQWFDGWVHSAGGMVLFLGLPGIFWGGRWARWLGVFSILGGIALYSHGRSGQALLPFFIPMLVVAAAGIVNAPRWRSALAALALAYFTYQLGLDGLRVAREAQALSGKEARDAYRAFREPYRPAYGWLTEHAAAGDLVLSLDPQAYFMRNPAYRNTGELARMAGGTRMEWLAWLKARGIRYALYPRGDLEVAPRYEGSFVAQAVRELLDDGELFRKVEAFSGDGGTVEVYRAAWK